MITIEQEVYQLLDQHELPIHLIKHAIVPFLDRAFIIIVCTMTRSDSKLMKPFLDRLVPYADGLCIAEYKSTDDTVSIIHNWYNELPSGSLLFSFEPGKSFYSFKQSKNELIDQATELASRSNLPFNCTFLCFVDIDEYIVCPNIRHLRRKLVQRTNCHYLVEDHFGYRMGLLRLSNMIRWTDEHMPEKDQEGNTFPIAKLTIKRVD